MIRTFFLEESGISEALFKRMFSFNTWPNAWKEEEEGFSFNADTIGVEELPEQVN